ncbi:MAG: PD-(D/E)XK nuclease family protein [Bacteroidota bacterium]
MNHFLAKCANYIFNQHKINELANISVILPTRRGTLAFKKSLAQQAQTPFIAPKIIAIEDFILETTQLQLMEPIDLVFELFNAIKKVDEKVKFELFMSWAPTLLKDFESIDQYMVNAKQLFAYMTEAKALERWNISELKSNNINFETSVEKYFELFKTLHTVYEEFNNGLKAKGLAYRGSAYRYLAENVESLLLDRLSYVKYYFLGFNALSISEETIIKTLVDAQKAETIWDTDDYYMKNLSNGQLAGRFLKEIKKSGRFGTDWNWQENDLLLSPKNIKIIGLPNTSLQPIVAAHYLENWSTNNLTKQSTALVLADETILNTVISQIPESVGNYNITMGLSLKESPIYGLLESIFNLHRFLKFENNGIIKFNTRLIIKLLNHIYIKAWSQKYEINLAISIREIQDANQLFLNRSDLIKLLKFENLTEVVFEHWNDSPQIAITQLRKIIQSLSIIFEDNSPLELNYLTIVEKIINRVEVIVESNPENINISGLKSILFEILKQTKLPFESNQEDNLQIMGMLETRTLDFERIILLSANEGNLPSGKKSLSLIPFDALIANEMPTYGHQDAIMAYHFFRLLQKAKEIIVLYTNPSSSNGNKEKSRFILQIEHELAHLNKNITIEYPEIALDFSKKEKIDSDFEIAKTDKIVEIIKTQLQTKGLYITSINEYIRCEMLYYFNRIAKIEEPSEIDESIGNDIFGTWVHKTLENIDLENLKNGGIISKERLIEIKNTIRDRLGTDFQNNFGKLSLNEGMNLILLNVAERVLQGYFNNEINNGIFPQEILAVEENLMVNFPLIFENQIFNIKLGGKVDKIDKVGESIRIIDYKTGKVEPKSLRLDARKSEDMNIESFLTKPELDKMRQLWWYKYLFLKGEKQEEKFGLNYELEVGIYSFRNNKEGFMTGIKYFTNASETDEEFISISENIILQFLEKLLNQSTPFRMTPDLKLCEYCTYRSICNR